jgi:3',5'-cyclic AMP phosphodiesterase CpdA
MPSGEPRLVLLHVSDLHFCDPEAGGHYWNTEATELAVAPHNRRGLLGSLLYDLRHEKLAPDLVIVSGDLLDRGNRKGVEPALAFLRGLAEGLGLPKERVIIVPGNHDVLRSGTPDERYALYDEMRSALYGASRPPFAKGTPAHRRVDHHVFEKDLRAEVVAWNSCEELEASEKQEHGSVGIGQRDFAEELLGKTTSKDLFRIAVLHHHLESPAGVLRTDYSVIPDAGGMRRWLAREKFHLALHGHQHVDWHDVREIDGWLLAIAAAASAGVASYGRNEWSLPIAYQVIVIESETRGRRIRREYDPQTMEWNDAGRGEDVQMLRFGPADVALASSPTKNPAVEEPPPSLARRGRIEVKIQHVERAIASQREALRVQLACLAAAVLAALAMALFLTQLRSTLFSVAGGLSLLCAGSIALPWRLAAYREAIDKLQFLRDGYVRCAAHEDDELAKMLDERFYRLI